MTAAGTSVQDQLSQLSEAASQALGFAEPPRDEEHADDEAGDGEVNGDQQKKQQQQTGHSKQGAPAGGQSGASTGSWFSGWLPRLPGPGNHPNNPESTANKDYYPDTVGQSNNDQGESRSSKARGKKSIMKDASQEDIERNKVTLLKSTQSNKDGTHDVVQRALEQRPKPPGHRDDEYDDFHRRVDPQSVRSKEPKHSKPSILHMFGNDSDDEDEGMKRNDSIGGKNAKKVQSSPSNQGASREKIERHPSAYPDRPSHPEHPANRGPMWASRPDDAQRAKIKEMKRQRNLQYKEDRRRVHDADHGRESARPSEDEESGQDDSARPTSDRTQSARLSSFLGTQRGKDKEKGKDKHQIPNEEASSDAAAQAKEGKDSKDASKDDSALAPLRGVLGSVVGTSTGEKQVDDPYADTSQLSEAKNKGQENGDAQKGHTEDESDSTPQKSMPTDEKHRHLNKISNLMLGKSSQPGTAQEEEAPAAGAGDDEDRSASDRWALLKQRVQATGAVAKRRADKQREQQRKRVISGQDMTAELQSGILPVFMLKMALERDEAGHRRVPVFLNHLHLRITDSVNPLSNTSAVFRVELSYGDDVIKWVVFRTIGDFIALHTHYRAAALRGLLGRAVRDSGTADGELGLPRFPKTSLPYFRQLQSQGRVRGDEARKIFARAQREALEEYIIAMMKRTMFRPEANRLCKFFELSALGISLASRGGFQGKQGYLKMLSKGGRKADQGVFSFTHTQEPKWAIVRESYILFAPGPETLEVHDVFMIDSEYRIERPKRLYKQMTHLAAEFRGHHEEEKEEEAAEADKIGTQRRNDDIALLTEGQFKRPKGGQDKSEDDETYDEKSGLSKNKKKKPENTNVSSHTFYISNAELRLKLSARSDRLLEQFIASMERVALHSPFSGSNRFGSFAPIRLKANAQWLIDGRDYYWELSRALLMAKDRIMIHDWWLSPELYLRRPGQPEWRLDNILQKKAREGVKIFVILYNEVANNFTPTDSGYSKSRLSALHPNIYVQRSPSHLKTGTFFWAHHEKMCAIDETIAFMGGFDLCFGRWDTPTHILVDDVDADYNKDGHSQANGDASKSELLGPADEQGREAHIWPGQDYANERVAEWSDLTKPAEDLFDRTRFPRMPWHDTGLQLIGQPARDLCRHFTQRWNFLLRNKNHKRRFPFLIPAPDFTAQELEQYKLTGTCEAQICRSAGPWSLGTSKTVEHSIQNAYLKCIQMSEHFVYIENQFFVTSTVVEGTAIENNIGNALVSRIIRAHREGTKWRAVIVIPLIPGFPMPISEPDASSVRIICDCQFRSICRGEHSIFGKLRKEGIDPDQYISFFSLRNWGKLKGGRLTTEQVYIHGKCAVFDDRISIIGSANINERSQRGDRDSELACVIRDTDMIDSRMADQPYKVGRFSHTMRLRLMREHCGIDVDALEQEEAHLDLQEVQSKTQEQRAVDDESEDEDEAKLDPDNEESRGIDAPEGDLSKVAARHRITELNRSAALAFNDASKGLKMEVKEYFSRDTKSKIQVATGSTSNPVEKAPVAHLDEDGDGGEEQQQQEELAQGDEPVVQDDAKKKDDNVTELLNVKKQGQRPLETEKPELSEGVGVGEHQGSETPPESAMNHLSTTIEERTMAEIQDGQSTGDAKQRSGNGATVSDGDDDEEEDEADVSRRIRAVSEGPSPDAPSSSGGRQQRVDASASAPLLQTDDVRKKIQTQMSANPWAPPLQVPQFDASSFIDPVSDSFFKDVWLATAIHNTQIYRKVFRCVPDDVVTNWSEYKAFMAWSDRLSKSGQFAGKEGKDERNDIPSEARGPGAHFNKAAAAKYGKDGAEADGEAKEKGSDANADGDARGHGKDQSNGDVNGNANSHADSHAKEHKRNFSTSKTSTHETHHEKDPPPPPPTTTTNKDPPNPMNDGFSSRELSQMESLLDETIGTLVVFPTRFLEMEDRANNFLFPMDKISPLAVYL